MTATNKNTTIIARIEKALLRHAKGNGVSVDKLASLANVDKDNVYRRVADLRNEGLNILSESRIVKGERKTFYRIAA